MLLFRYAILVSCTSTSSSLVAWPMQDVNAFSKLQKAAGLQRGLCVESAGRRTLKLRDELCICSALSCGPLLLVVNIA
jgi:hypothetical protein